MNLVRFVILSVVLLAFSASAGAAQGNITGVWQSANGTHIAIDQCAENYCGKIAKVRVKPEIYNKFKEQIETVGEQNLPDYFNKDPKLKNRKLLGMQILTMAPANGGAVFEGQIYNAEDGNIYSGRLEQLSSDKLRLTGCVLKVLCQSEEWVRIK